MNRSTMEQLMQLARAEAELSWSEGGIPVGAVLAREDGTVVARGHNQRVQSGDPTSHGETQCIRNAGRRRDWRELTLVTTLSPCPMCSGAIQLYGIPRVVVGENKTFQGPESILRSQGITVEILQNPECIALMKDFIQAKPELWNEDIGVPTSESN